MDGGRSRRSACREAMEAVEVAAAAVGSVGIVVDVEGSKAGPKILPIILDCFLLNFGGLFFPLTKRVEDPSVGWTFILRRGIATTEELFCKKYIQNTFGIHQSMQKSIQIHNEYIPATVSSMKSEFQSTLS